MKPISGQLLRDRNGSISYFLLESGHRAHLGLGNRLLGLDCRRLARHEWHLQGDGAHPLFPERKHFKLVDTRQRRFQQKCVRKALRYGIARELHALPQRGRVQTIVVSASMIFSLPRDRLAPIVKLASGGGLSSLLFFAHHQCTDRGKAHIWFLFPCGYRAY